MLRIIAFCRDTQRLQKCRTSKVLEKPKLDDVFSDTSLLSVYFKFSVYVTMDKLTVLVTLNLISFTVSISLFLLIHKYIERKAPAWQSILDLLLLDGSKAMIVHNVLLFIMNFLGITSGLTIVASEILLGITTSVSMLIISMQEIVLVLKALIIFKPGLLVDLPDLKVINLFRRT